MKYKNLMVSLAIAGLILSRHSEAQVNKTSPESIIEKAKQEVVAAVPSSRKHSIGIGIGQTFLLQNFSDDGDDKITADFFYGYSASHSFDFLLNFHFSKHENNSEEVNLFGITMDIKSKVYDFDSFAPYVMGGLGFYMPTTTRRLGGNLVESDDKMVFGVNVGAGADLRLNEKFSIGVLTQLHKPFNVDQENQKDVSGAYFKLMLVGMYHY